MKKGLLSIIVLLITVFAGSSLLPSCAKIIRSECELEFFEGSFTGSYQLGVINLPAVDTIIIERLEGTKVNVTSKALDVTLEANYLTSNDSRRIELDLFTSEQFDIVIGGNVETLFGITIQSGTAILDAGCDNLTLTLEDIVIEDYTSGFNAFLSGKPYRLSALNGANMRRIN